MLLSSPRMWRCFPIRTRSAPCKRSSPRMWRCFQQPGEPAGVEPWSSPRMWRCFQKGVIRTTKLQVFSTHVEVFLALLARSLTRSGLLHACGGVSNEVSEMDRCKGSSPRMWRCFQRLFVDSVELWVFSTHVEVFPERLRTSIFAPGSSPRMWRCFYQGLYIYDIARESSPRMWRCFLRLRLQHRRDRVFSTHVEMFSCKIA